MLLHALAEPAADDEHADLCERRPRAALDVRVEAPEGEAPAQRGEGERKGRRVMAVRRGVEEKRGEREQEDRGREGRQRPLGGRVRGRVRGGAGAFLGAWVVVVHDREV